MLVLSISTALVLLVINTSVGITRKWISLWLPAVIAAASTLLVIMFSLLIAPAQPDFVAALLGVYCLMMCVLMLLHWRVFAGKS